jgi:hypothetical protein
MASFLSARPRLLTATFGALFAAAAFAGNALADTETMNNPTVGIMTNPCNGDTFPFTGRFQVTYHTSTDETGGIHVYLHNVTLSGSGTAPSGTDYVFNGNLRNIQQSSDPEHHAVTYQGTGEVIGTGPTDDYYVRAVLHITIVAGQPVVETSMSELGCRG